MAVVNTDICIIGAGPVGLFAVFETGLLKMRCHVVDVLGQVGGQLSEIYPKKPIFDIPGFPEINAQELVDNLKKQIEPFHATYSLAEQVAGFRRLEDGSFILTTSENTEVHCKAVIIAAGLGSFEPRKPELEHLSDYEGKGVLYMVRDPELFRNKKIVLAGGGDSALDWTIQLTEVASKLTLIHRNESFRGAPDSAEKVVALAKAGKIDLVLSSDLKSIQGSSGTLRSVTYVTKDEQSHEVDADYLIPLFGFSPKLGPIAEWGLNMDKNTIQVNTFDYSTNIPGVFAIGDINSYPGKLKLILCGFHEGALAAQGAFKYVYPNQKLSFKYTTVSGIHEF